MRSLQDVSVLNSTLIIHNNVMLWAQPLIQHCSGSSFTLLFESSAFRKWRCHISKRVLERKGLLSSGGWPVGGAEVIPSSYPGKNPTSTCLKYRALQSHVFTVRHTHINQFTRSHAVPCISHAEKGRLVPLYIRLIDEGIRRKVLCRDHSCLELYHLPANQKLGCCCFRVNYAILPQHGCWRTESFNLALAS